MIPSRSSRYTRITAAFIGLFLLAPSSGRSGEEKTVPRYRLKVGQELTYHGTDEFHYERGFIDHRSASAVTRKGKTDWQVWVVRKNDDGSWRLVLRFSRAATSALGSEKPREFPARVYMGYCDVFDDGRLGRNETRGYYLDPHTLFPRLPADARAAGRGWEDFNRRDVDDIRSRFTLAREDKDAADLWVFEEIRESPLDAIYLSSSKTRFFFDPKRGLIARSKGENTQSYVNGKGISTLELQDVKEQDDAWMKRFAEEAECYFTANKAYEELTRKAEKQFKDTPALLAEAEKTLKGVRAKLTVPVLRERVDQQIKDHANQTRYLKKDAEHLAEVVGKPAPAWEVKDLDGKDHSLESYRGKVVILDFWYRGCGWCIRAMPQVVQVAEDFKNEPVVVLGMNIDHDEKNARFVVDKMKIRYPVLRAEGLPQKYKVSGFPTLIIIDQKGDVHDVHIGYSPTLRQEVSASVRALLNK